jgi:hypothetical protein
MRAGEYSLTPALPKDGILSPLDSELTMLRWTVTLIAVVAVVGTAAAAAEAPVVPKRGASRAASQLPPGLPRPHYKYRTTVAPPTYGRPVVVVETDPDVLITPAYGPGGYLDNLPGTPLLPGSSTIPGYYGRAFDYDYQGPYYGGPYVGYWDRLPYACGVYGYC